MQNIVARRRWWWKPVVAGAGVCGMWLVLSIGAPTPAARSAGDSPHGGYAAVTNSCAGCHGAHSSQAAGLLAATGDQLCATCHNGSGAAPTPVLTHEGRQCMDCHDPHGTANYAAIREWIRGAENPGPVVFDTPGDFAPVCAACHDSSEFDHAEGLACGSCHTHTAGFEPSEEARLAVAAAVLARGFALYDEAGCTACHGADGTLIDFGDEDTPLFLAHSALADPVRFADIVLNGLPDTAMPSHDLTSGQVDDLLAFVQTLPTSTAAPEPDVPEEPLAEPPAEESVEP